MDLIGRYATADFSHVELITDRVSRQLECNQDRGEEKWRSQRKSNLNSELVSCSQLFSSSLSFPLKCDGPDTWKVIHGWFRP